MDLDNLVTASATSIFNVAITGDWVHIHSATIRKEALNFAVHVSLNRDDRKMRSEITKGAAAEL